MELTKEQIDNVEAMIERRMSNTGESRTEACEYIATYLRQTYEGNQPNECMCCGEPF